MRVILMLLLIGVSWIFLFSMPGEAADEPVYIKNFYPDDYGFHRQNWGIIRDDRGIMYFANTDGVLEFDSRFWRLIPLGNGQGAYSLAKDRQGRIYVGGEGEIGRLAADETGTLRYRSLLEQIPGPYRRFKGRVIRAEAFPGGIVFLSDRLLFILNNERVEVFSTQDHFFSFLYAHGTLYVIDGVRGLLRLQGGRLREVPGGKMLRAYVMFPFKDNKLLIVTTQQGPIIFDPFAGAHSNSYYPFMKTDHDFFSDNLISCGVLVDDNYIALGSHKKGIIVINCRSGRSLHFSKSNGLADNHVYGIYRDTRGNIWLGMDNGISLIPIIKSFCRGVQGGQFFQKAPPLAAGGKNTIPFAALIRGCWKFTDDSVIFGGTFYSRENGIQLPDQPGHQILTFPFDNNTFRFVFVSNGYYNTEKISYQCYMQGLDGDWSNWSNRVSREYTNLDGGKYTFRVRARNHLGEISREAAYSFRIRCPWHETWWFLTAQVVFIILLLVVPRLIGGTRAARRFSDYLVIFTVIVIFKYITNFFSPFIGRYSSGIGFFKIFMTALLALILKPAQGFVKKVLEKIVKGK